MRKEWYAMISACDRQNFGMAAKKKPELRVYIEPDLDKLIRLLAALHETTLSDVVTKALEHWVDLPENQEFIEKHNLDKLD
jgi:uncharacterized protein (DUF1778 family)